MEQQFDRRSARDSGGGGVDGVDVDSDQQVRLTGRQELMGGGDHLRLDRAGKKGSARSPVGIDHQNVAVRPGPEPLGADHPGERPGTALGQPGLNVCCDGLHGSSTRC